MANLWEGNALPPMPKEPPVPLRQSLLEEAMTIVNGPRNTSYGAAEDNFERIAAHWRVFLKNRFDVDLPLTAGDVGIIMALMKIARLEFDPDHYDSWVDLAGYAATGYQAQKNRKRAA